ncbi:MAG: hypothetical protein ACLQU2_13850 [Candidatus Binataceae bacterium]
MDTGQQRRCAYCRGTGDLTKEELFSKFLAEKAGFKLFVDRLRKRAPERRPPTVRDVCRICNNVRLGELDQRAAHLFKNYFLVPLVQPICVRFQYDFHLLQRWLLKSLYNEARATRDAPEAFDKHVPYILGDVSEPISHIVLMVGVFEASDAQPEEIANGIPPKYPPLYHGFGRIGFNKTKWPRVFFSIRRAFSVASYFFVVLEFCAETPRHIRDEIISQVARETRLIVLPHNSREILITTCLTNARDYLLNKHLSGRYQLS